MTQYVYFFGGDQTEGNQKMKELLGGKGANLAEMANAGLPVPPGFTISTEACHHYSSHRHTYPEGLLAQVKKNLSQLEKLMGKKLGAAHDPLLVSVRSGAAVSMPGMMDTVLNLGMNDRSVLGFIEQSGHPQTGWDSYRRFIDMFGSVVMAATGLTHEDFEAELSRIKKKYQASDDNDLTADQLQELVEAYKKVYQKKVKKSFPEDPMEQLTLSINAVFDSWDSDRAVKYRQLNKIGGLEGTGVNVQAMVFGNMGKDLEPGSALPAIRPPVRINRWLNT